MRVRVHKALAMALAGVMTMAAAVPADAATAKREAAGTLADGTAVEAVTLTARPVGRSTSMLRLSKPSAPAAGA